jgi:hypothetical protein
MLFCPYCGTKRALDVSGIPLEVEAEKILGKIPNVRMSSEVRGDGRFTVLVTDQRLIFARMTESDIRSVQPSRGLGGLAALSRNDPDRGAGAPYADKYNEMSLSDVLAETSGNFSMRNQEVRSVDLTSDEDGATYVMRFRSLSEEFVLTMSAQHDNRDLLIDVFGDRVRW